MSDGEGKPKKSFTVIHTVWDDGEIDTELYQWVQNPSGRGAPGKWRKKPEEFIKALEDTLGSPKLLIEDMVSNTGMSLTQIVGANIVAGLVSQPTAPTVTKIDDSEAALIDGDGSDQSVNGQPNDEPNDELPNSDDLEFNGNDEDFK
jgi:hypothetical protein